MNHKSRNLAIQNQKTTANNGQVQTAPAQPKRKKLRSPTKEG